MPSMRPGASSGTPFPFLSTADAAATYLTQASAAANYMGDGEELPRPIWLTSRDFYAGAGSPTENLVNNRWSCWYLRDFNYDRIVASVALPQNTAVDIDLIWCSLNTGTSGQIAQFRIYRGAKTVTDSMSSVSQVGSNVTDFAKGQYEICRTRLASSMDTGTDMVSHLMIDRIAGAEAGDTLNASLAVLGVLISPVDQRVSVLEDDGTWCWFNEPRAICDEGRGLVYASYVTHDGSLGVTALDTSDSTTSAFTLSSQFEVDDHDVPGLLVRSDGKLMAFYCSHNVTDDPIYWRQTSSAGDISAWGSEQTITLTAGAKPTYPMPVQIGSRLYVFYRNEYDRDFIYSDDDGATWSATERLVNYTAPYRGYMNLVQNGSRVDFIVGDDNPNDSSTNLYHFYLDTDSLYKSDGTLISTIANLSSGITTSQMTKIYDYATQGSAWGWDIQLDANSRPRVVYATLTADDHRYRYAYWDGSAWVDSQITTAGGGSIVDRGTESNYSPGISLVASDTSVVYLSKFVQGNFEMYRYVTTDDGATWSGTPVTVRSRDKQIRPTSPDGHFAAAPECLWLSGWYVDYFNYQTRIVYPSS